MRWSKSLNYRDNGNKANRDSFKIFKSIQMNLYVNGNLLSIGSRDSLGEKI